MEDPVGPPEYVSIGAAACRLGVSPRRVHRLLADTKLRGAVIDGQWRVLRVSVERRIAGIANGKITGSRPKHSWWEGNDYDEHGRIFK